MSELKSYKNLECAFSTSSQQEIVVAEDSEGGSIVFEEGDEVYLKSETDKVIAEKDKELRHQKYKRCLAMASSCSDKASAEYASSYVSCDEYYYHHAEFWNKWHKRWLELAEKFKEAK